jgi:hypothetical protein
MPKISSAQGASHAGVIAEHDADLREEDGVQPQERPGEGNFHAERNGVDAPEEGTDYSTYTVKQLVAEIERRNADDGKDLSTTGNKGDLVARLVEDDEADAEEE